MSGSDEVGVDPGRVSQAAGALENLRDVLAANVPTIVNIMNEYWSSGAGSPVSLAGLHQAQSRSVDDATQMRTRAQLAEAWLAQGVSLAGSGIVTIPFSGPALDNADATVEAQALADAEAQASTNPSAARTKIAAIEQEIKEHAGDGSAGAPWLQDFYNDAAPAVANLASTLHGLENGNSSLPNYQNRFTVLTQEDQKILATFGQGLAAADAAGLSPEAVQAIANAPDAWSAAMLVKFGPPGSLWATGEPKTPQNPDGLSLLAQLTNHVYEQEQNGTLRIPIGNGGNYSAQDRDQLANVLSEYDPLQVMMQADAQNKNAAWQVMGGKDGNALAQMLLGSVKGDLPNLDGRFVQGPMNNQGQHAGYFTLYPPGKSVPENESWGQILLNTPDQNVVGAFLDAATSAPRGNDVNARYSAQAALNIILNTPPPLSSSYDGSYAGQSPPVQRALLDTALRYELDLAESTTYDGSGTVLHFDNLPGNPYVIKVPGVQAGTSSDPAGTTPLSTFLREVLADPASAGTLTASVKTAMGRYYAISQTAGFPPGGPSAPDQDMAALLGRINTEAGNIKFNAAQQQDEQNAETNSLIDFAKDAVTWVPVVGDYADKAESVANLFGVIPELSTDNAVITQQVNEHDFAVAETKINVPMVQALISAHAVPASALQDQPWLQNGQIVLNGSNAAAFSTWYDEYKGSLGHLADKESQYQFLMQQQEQLTEDKAGGGGS
jgi:hypothetical protein